MTGMDASIGKMMATQPIPDSTTGDNLEANSPGSTVLHVQCRQKSTTDDDENPADVLYQYHILARFLGRDAREGRDQVKAVRQRNLGEARG